MKLPLQFDMKMHQTTAWLGSARLLKSALWIGLTGVMCSFVLLGQTSPATGASHGAGSEIDAPKALDAPSDYVLGPGDQLGLIVSDLEENFSGKVFRVGLNGEVSLPFVGRLHPGGLTLSQFEMEIGRRLVELHTVKHPQVVVTIVAFGSQPVSVLGAVMTPGIKQLEGRKSLFEVLSLAGGLRADAGFSIRLSRDPKWGAVPLKDAQTDPVSHRSTGTVQLKDVINETGSQASLIIMPNDIISVPKAGVVYAVGSVVKPGGFTLNEHETMSALQVVALAEGLLKTAAPKQARILRLEPGASARVEIAVNLRSLMEGKGSDIQLRADDILFIPNSTSKVVTGRAVETAISLLTGLAIYARY